MLRRLMAGLRARARELRRAIVADLKRGHLERMDQAYIATRGDRPFMGCGPCAPGVASAPAEPRRNPTAVGRDE